MYSVSWFIDVLMVLGVPPRPVPAPEDVVALLSRRREPQLPLFEATRIQSLPEREQDKQGGS